MTPDPLITAVLAEMERLVRNGPGSGPDHQTQRLLRTPDRMALVLDRILTAQSDSACKTDSALLEHMLTEAVMDQENQGPWGEAFLTAIDHQLARHPSLGAEAPITAGHILVARGYARVNHPLPDSLRAHFRKSQTHDGPPPDDAEKTTLFRQARREVAKVIKSLGSDPSALYDAFHELLALLPPPARPSVMDQVAKRPEPAAAQVMRWWLWDRNPDLRQDAAEMWAKRIAAGQTSADDLTRLARMLPWMPEDGARAHLSRALAASPLPVAANETRPTQAPIRRDDPVAWVTLPDGTGAQTITVVRNQGRATLLVTILIKDPVGIKDALVQSLPGLAADQILAEIKGLGAMAVPLSTAGEILARAGQSGLDTGRPPHPLLLDSLESLGLGTLAPLPADWSDWLAAADPTDAVAALSPQKRGRLINESVDWMDRFPILQSWFEDSPDLRESLAGLSSPTTARAKQAVTAVLDQDRARARWSLRLLKGAYLLRLQGQVRDSQGFVAVARALVEGRPLGRIPLFEDVVSQTLVYQAEQIRLLMADEAPREDRPEDGDGKRGGPDVVFRPAGAMDRGAIPVPNSADTSATAEGMAATRAFADRLNQSAFTLTAPVLDGLLTALAVGPVVVPPSAWLGLIWSGKAPLDNDSVQTVIDRYNHLNDAYHLGKGPPPPALVSRPAGPADAPLDLGPWAEGVRLGLSLNADIWSELVDGPDGEGLVWPLLALCQDDEGQSLAGLSATEQAELQQDLLPEVTGLMRAIAAWWQRPPPRTARKGRGGGARSRQRTPGAEQPTARGRGPTARGNGKRR